MVGERIDLAEWTQEEKLEKIVANPQKAPSVSSTVGPGVRQFP